MGVQSLHPAFGATRDFAEAKVHGGSNVRCNEMLGAGNFGTLSAIA